MRAVTSSFIAVLQQFQEKWQFFIIYQLQLQSAPTNLWKIVAKKLNTVEYKPQPHLAVS